MKKYIQLITAITFLFLLASYANAQVITVGFNPVFSSSEAIISPDGTEVALIYDSPKSLTEIQTDFARYHISDPNIGVTSVRSTLPIQQSGQGVLLLKLASSISAKSDLTLNIDAGVLVNLAGSSVQTNIPLRPIHAKIEFMRGLDINTNGIQIDDIVRYLYQHPNVQSMDQSLSEVLSFIEPILLDKSSLTSAIASVQTTLLNIPGSSNSYLTAGIDNLRNSLNSAQVVQSSANTTLYNLVEAASNLSNAAFLYQNELILQANRTLGSPLSIVPLNTSTIGDNIFNAFDKSLLYSNSSNYPRYVVELPVNTGSFDDYAVGDKIYITAGAALINVEYALTSSDIGLLNDHTSNNNSVSFTIDAKSLYNSAPDLEFTPKAYVKDGTNSTNLSPGMSASHSIIIDTTAPALSVYYSGSINYGNSFNTRNSEIGAIYVVPSGTTADLTSVAQAASSSGKAVNTPAANNLYTVSTTSLNLGNYVVYAADQAGNLSVPSSVLSIVAAGITTTDNSIQAWGSPLNEVRVAEGITAGTLLNKLSSTDPANAPLSITTSNQTVVTSGTIIADGMLIHVGSSSTYTIKTRANVATYNELTAALNSGTSSIIKITADIASPNNSILLFPRLVSLEADNPVTLTALRFSGSAYPSNNVRLKAIVQNENELNLAMTSVGVPPNLIEIAQPIGAFTGTLHYEFFNNVRIYLNPDSTMAFVDFMGALKEAVNISTVTDVYITSNLYSNDTLNLTKSVTIRTDPSSPKNVIANLFINKSYAALANVFLTKMNPYTYAVEGSSSLTFVNWSGSQTVAAGNKYVYRNFGSGALPASIIVNSSDWTNYSEMNNIPALDNDKIVIAEVNSTDLSLVDAAVVIARVSPYGLYATKYTSGDDLFLATNLPNNATVRVYSSLESTTPLAVGVQHSSSVSDDVYFPITGGYAANQYGVYASITLDSEPEGKRIPVYVDTRTVQTINNDLFMYNISYSDTQFALPWVPKGYKIEIATSNNLAAIDLAGNIHHLSNNTFVSLTFTIKSIFGNDLGTTQSFTVMVPGLPS